MQLYMNYTKPNERIGQTITVMEILLMKSYFWITDYPNWSNEVRRDPSISWWSIETSGGKRAGGKDNEYQTIMYPFHTGARWVSDANTHNPQQYTLHSQKCPLLVFEQLKLKLPLPPLFRWRVCVWRVPPLSSAEAEKVKCSMPHH